jgi:hypothetical protein
MDINRRSLLLYREPTNQETAQPKQKTRHHRSKAVFNGFNSSAVHKLLEQPAQPKGFNRRAEPTPLSAPSHATIAGDDKSTGIGHKYATRPLTGSTNVQRTISYSDDDVVVIGLGPTPYAHGNVVDYIRQKTENDSELKTILYNEIPLIVSSPEEARLAASKTISILDEYDPDFSSENYPGAFEEIANAMHSEKNEIQYIPETEEQIQDRWATKYEENPENFVRMTFNPPNPLRKY